MTTFKLINHTFGLQAIFCGYLTAKNTVPRHVFLKTNYAINILTPTEASNYFEYLQMHYMLT